MWARARQRSAYPTSPTRGGIRGKGAHTLLNTVLLVIRPSTRDALDALVKVVLDRRALLRLDTLCAFHPFSHPLLVPRQPGWWGGERLTGLELLLGIGQLLLFLLLFLLLLLGFGLGVVLLGALYRRLILRKRVSRLVHVTRGQNIPPPRGLRAPPPIRPDGLPCLRFLYVPRLLHAPPGGDWASLLPVYPQKREKRTVDSAGASASAVAQGVAASTRSVMVSQKPMAAEVGEDNTVVNWGRWRGAAGGGG